MTQFSIESEREGDAHTVALFGELDLATATEVEEELERVEAGEADLVLDLRGLAFMDSTGLRVLLAAAGRAQTNGSSLRIINGPEAVRKVIRLAGVEERLPLADS